ncbi:MAG TPA: alpha/beta hydrolase [Polyangiaceae bacterium]|nr:alpha/beta hydrolase [Polyangiaceae bacterium]
MPILDLNGKNIFVETSGEGPALLFVHGLGGSTTLYEAQARALASKRRVVRFDLEGHGRSALSGGELSMASFAADALAVLNELGIASVDIVAHSMGTIPAQHLAVHHRDRVGKIALLGPLREQSPAAKEATRARAATVREKGMEAVATAVANGATSPTVQRERPEILGFVRELLLAQNPEGYARACEALADAKAVDLSGVDAPVLLLRGDDDKVSTKETVDAMRKELAHVETGILEGCGHWTPIEAAARVTTALVKFF